MDVHKSSDEARRVARQLLSNPGTVTRAAGLDLADQALGSSSAAAAAAQLQQKQPDLAMGSERQQQRDQGRPAAVGPTQDVPSTATIPAAPDAEAMTKKPASSSPIHQQQRQPAEQQQQQRQAGSNLAPAATSQGPIITTSLEGSAAAQQALRLMNTYDFKIYGQGLMAGPTAAPLPGADQKVMYVPPAEPSEAASDTASAASATGAAAGGPNAAAAAMQEPTISMKPLPVTAAPAAASSTVDQRSTSPAGSNNQQLQQLQQQAAGQESRQCGTCFAFEEARQQQLQQLYRRPKQQLQQRQGYSEPEITPATAAAAAAADRGYLRQTLQQQQKQQQRQQAAKGGRLQRAWQSAKASAGNALEDATAWLLHMLWLLICWLVRLLLVPVKAVFGPWYKYNRRLKARSSELLAQQELDLSQLQEVLGALPSWLSGIGGATEKLEWLNTLLAQVWPILDPVVCALIKSSIEPLLDDMKPPFIAAMGFQKLTLGELPLVLEGIRVVGGDKQGVSSREPAQSPADRAATAAASATQDDRLEVEVDFQWVGEPNISFFVELALAGPYTRLVPKVSHLTSRGTVRLGLTRLCPQLPGFGAIMISLARTPQVKFTLDFGPALGGKFTAKPVAAFLDPFLRDTLANLVVWPNRFIVPLLPRSVTGNLDDLALHSVGLLQVEVLTAKHLPKKGGPLSTVDPQVELWTQPQHRVHSSVKKGSRNPSWRGQALEVLVQEPDSQQLRVIMHDIDMLNLKELLRVNLLKGASNLLRSANPIGRAALPLRDICSQPFKRQEVELRLSGSEWAYELGVVEEEDAGTLNLALTYRPFTDMDAASSAPIDCRGVLFVDVRQCQDLASADWDSGSSDPYVLLKVAGQKQQTAVVPHSTSPTFNAHFEFFNVQVPDVLQVQVWDRDYLKPDDLIGQLELPVKTIITWTQQGKRGWRDGWWRLQDKHGKKGHDECSLGKIEMKVQYRPYSS